VQRGRSEAEKFRNWRYIYKIENLNIIMGLKDWREVIDLDFPDVEITEETKRTMVEAGRRYLINDVRLATGRFYTTAEYEARRERVLSTPLP
jgi:hypothetical protein